MKARTLTALVAACLAVTCGGGGGSSQDIGTDDSVSPDAVDGIIDVPPDSPLDIPVDVPVDGTPDTTPDTVVDADEDATPDVDPDTTIACELDGGYCTTYAITSAPCVTCASVGGVSYVPSPGPDGSNECTATGEGVGAWCCMPVADDPPECVTNGGVCVPPGGGGDRCPVGWVSDTSGWACNGSHVCCVEGESC